MQWGLSGRVLPAHPQPKPGEIFSSWLCRIAQHNSMKLRTLERELWGPTKPIWNRDIDRSVDDQTLHDVARACATPIEAARETCLRSYEGILFHSLNSNGHSEWILPTGVYHRKRTRNGMQFCPRCLAEDMQSYFRKVWRLSLATFCDLHHVLLHDCCPACRAPVMFHRQELGSRNKSDFLSLSICTTCGFDLERSAVYAVPIFDYRVWNAMWEHLCFLDFGWTFLEKQTFHYSPLYFEALRHLIGRLLSTKTIGNILPIVESAHPGAVRFIVRPQVPFEFYGVAERNAILQVATWLLLDWPDRFLQVCREAKIRHSELINFDFHLPFWFYDGVHPLSINPVGPSPGERQAMRCLLEQAENDEIKLNWLKRHIAGRIALQPIKVLWEEDSLPVPRKWGPGVDIQVAAYKTTHGGSMYGLRVSGLSKMEFLARFPMAWKHVDIEIDGIVYRFPLRGTFWKKSCEFNGPMIKSWLAKRGLLEWRHRHPPAFWMIELCRQRFRLES